MTSYPFASWEDYHRSLAFRLTGKLDLAYEIDDVRITREMLARNMDATDGLNSFLRACIEGSRYLRELRDSRQLYKILELFLRSNARLDMSLLLDPPPVDDGTDPEWYLQQAVPRAILLDELAAQNGQPNEIYNFSALYRDWNEIIACYWEYIPERIVASEMTRAYRMSLKYESTFLAKIK